MRQQVNGFTLMELLIAVAIVGIIAAIAIPSYTSHVQKAKRAEAQAALVSLASALEMWKMQKGGSYNTGSPTAAGLLSNQVPVAGGTKTYDLAISSVTATAFTLTATPVKTDSLCGSLTYTNLGVRGPTTAGCW